MPVVEISSARGMKEGLIAVLRPEVMMMMMMTITILGRPVMIIPDHYYCHHYHYRCDHLRS